MTNDILNKIWPEWQIEEKPLGRGAYGVVYKAVRRDQGFESCSAIKIISIPSDPSEVDSLRSDGLDVSATKTYLRGVVNDFVNEIQLMESLKGVQNIVSVEDYKVVEKQDEIGWNIYIRMELLTPFNNYTCDKELTEEEIIKLGCDICTALEICGKRNIIHRDIKPANIFINDFGHFKLGDFGIARKLENMTGALSQKGTPDYIAPEVVNGRDYDARVDIYSLGLVLYRLLNGKRLPFVNTEKQVLSHSERMTALERRIHGEELPVPCGASATMADLILRACAYAPDMRFASATEMKQALMSVANNTYQIKTEYNLDETISVRKASVNGDETFAVRRPLGMNVQATGRRIFTTENDRSMLDIKPPVIVEPVPDRDSFRNCSLNETPFFTLPKKYKFFTSHHTCQHSPYEKGTLLIPGGYTAIGRYAFGYSSFPSRVERLLLSNTIELIQESALCGLHITDYIDIPRSVMRIEWNGLPSLGEYAYVKCEKDTYAYQYCKEHNIRNSVDGIPLSPTDRKLIKPEADNLTATIVTDKHCVAHTIYITDAMSVGKGSFRNRDDFDVLVLGRNVKYIKGNAFCNCRNLKYVYFSDTVCSIASNAFEGCSNLKYLYFDYREFRKREEPFYLAETAFDDCNKISFVVSAEKEVESYCEKRGIYHVSNRQLDIFDIIKGCAEVQSDFADITHLVSRNFVIPELESEIRERT